ncbi:methyltransferase domain-containing protein [Flavobacterium sp. NRK1]|uniref:methyltransferase domain-containing protein n=1 Tax=Flavobacterium sp. NRK1 TaxID=2954929 RepID=UPI002091E815|nr:methyltransferase domain-containing protein [Flavobacterium sp. NRK1]MCO6148512.1 class I SAM-dependent methyltransferase [Flavobacterium sp. NRK1]
MSAEKEKTHYELHNNNPEDSGYQKFVSPVTSVVLQNFESTHKGLDFGSGTGSPVVKVLQDNNYDIDQYDLYFHNNPDVLKKQYNYVTCTEVAEHFKAPYREFELLKKLLLPNGKLYVMTDLFNEKIDFATWYYKNDHTHVFLYHAKAFEWIKTTFDFKRVTIDNRLIILEL